MGPPAGGNDLDELIPLQADAHADDDAVPPLKARPSASSAHADPAGVTESDERESALVPWRMPRKWPETTKKD